MYYIECTHCSFSNPLKSEYVLFCEQCGEKLENTFQDWKIKHPGKSFEEYCTLECNQDPGIPLNATSLRPKRKYPLFYYVLATCLVLGIVYFGGRFTARKLAPYLQRIQATSITSNSKWERQICGTSGLSVESPVRLMKTLEKLPEEVDAKIDTIQIYACVTSGGFSLYLKSITFIPSFPVFRESALKSTIAEIQYMSGVTELNYTKQKTKIRAKEGMFAEGTYLFKKEYMGFKNIVLVDDNRLWQVMVKYHASDSLETQAAKRIVRSIDLH
jgi:hypothetical protein